MPTTFDSMIRADAMGPRAAAMPLFCCIQVNDPMPDVKSKSLQGVAKRFTLAETVAWFAWRDATCPVGPFSVSAPIASAPLNDTVVPSTGYQRSDVPAASLPKEFFDRWNAVAAQERDIRVAVRDLQEKIEVAKSVRTEKGFTTVSRRGSLG